MSFIIILHYFTITIREFKRVKMNQKGGFPAC